jgi:signal transduction histidine kinase/CheY-like chemotaxis protein/HPt (histidine-containing phosphotransfer) domain-containing protein
MPVHAQRVTEAILDGMADAVTLFDAERRAIYRNAAAERLFAGTPMADSRGMTVLEMAQALIAAGDRLVIEGRALSAEEWTAHVLRPGGVRYERRLLSGRDVEISYTPLPDGSLLGIHRDITETKQRQSELEQARDKAASAERLMNAVLETMTDGVRLYDADTRLVYQNSAISRVLSADAYSSDMGLPVEQIFRRRISEANEASLIAERTSRLEERVAQFRDPRGGRYEVRRANGRRIDVTIRPVGDGRRLGVFRDVTELRNREEELERARDHLQDARQLMAEMLEGMSDGVRLFDASMRLVYENSAIADIYGIPPGTSQLGMTIAEILQAQQALGMPLTIDGKAASIGDIVARATDPRGARYERVMPNGRHAEFQFRPLNNGRTLCVVRDITELRRQQAEAAAAQQLMATVLDGMTDGVKLFDADERLIYENAAADIMFAARKPGSDIGKTGEDIIGHGVDWEVAAAKAGGVAFTGPAREERLAAFRNPRGGKYDLRLHNGQYVEIRFLPVGGGRILGVYRDITELKRREAEITEAQQLMNTVLENMIDGVRLFDGDERLIYENAVLGAMVWSDDTPALGTPAVEILRRHIAQGDVLSGEAPLSDLEHRMAEFRRRDGGGYEVVLRNGRILEIRFRPAGNRGTLGIYRDVTESRRRQLDLERARDEMAATQRLMNTVLENMTDGVRLFDAGERLIYENSAVSGMSGPFTGSELGMSVEDIFRRRIARGDGLLGGPEPADLGHRMGEFRKRQGGGYEVAVYNGQTLEVRFRPAGNGLTLGVYRNITELKRRQDDAERARVAAEAANRAKSAFLATMSHEIRTPMNGVIGTAELLELEPLTPAQKRLVRTIRTSATALLGILDDVLDFSKIEADRLDLEIAPFSLRGVIRGTIDTFLAQADRKGLRISATVAPSTPDLIAGDATRVRQILLNLVGNALKFTESGEIRVDVNVEEGPGDRARLAFRIVDTGIGMNADQIERLFQPFSQGDSSTTRRYGGTGLGLSIVQRLAGMMGGEVKVESTPGEGSVFTVTLELRLAEEAANDDEGGATVSPVASALGAVLAIDDSAVNLEVLVGQLKALGLQPDTAEDGLEGLARWRERSYALIITDLHMPGLDGLEMTRLIRSEEARCGTGRRTPIIALTANALKGEDERAMAAGLDGYLTKPLTLRRLREALKRWIDTSLPAPPRSIADPESDDAQPPIDRSVLDETLGGDKALIDSVLRHFAAIGTKLVAALREAADDREELVRLAHKLKGTARAAGAMRLGDLAAVLESSLRTADIAMVEEEWRRVARDLGT